MAIFRAEFFTAADWAFRVFDAETPELALEAARQFYADNLGELNFQSYDAIEPLDHVQIWDAERGTVASWESEDYRLRLAAADLRTALVEQTAAATRADVYSRVTAKIVADLERGLRPWLKPWNAEHAAGRITRPLRGNGQPYKGINVLMLWGEAELKGFACPIWMTFRQAQELGANVRKGEHGSLVVYADKITRTETDENGEEALRQIAFMKGYTVFNCEQIEGLPAHFYATATSPKSDMERIAGAESFAANSGAAIRHGGDRAYYSVTNDYVQMPPFECFRDAGSYYATLLHELTHWTRHETRLNREFGRKRWGDAGYAAEELVAEMGAAFLCADIGVTPEPREDHAAYLASWLEVLSEDNRAVFTAAAHAQRAADYLHGLQNAPVFAEVAA